MICECCLCFEAVSRNLYPYYGYDNPQLQIPDFSIEIISIFVAVQILMNMDRVIKLDNVDHYNSLYGLETLHPLVSVVDLTKATKSVNHIQMTYGLYALFLKELRTVISSMVASIMTIRKEPSFALLPARLPE